MIELSDLDGVKGIVDAGVLTINDPEKESPVVISGFPGEAAAKDFFEFGDYYTEGEMNDFIRTRKPEYALVWR